MRVIAGIFCLSAALASAPAFAQSKDSAPQGPQALSGAAAEQSQPDVQLQQRGDLSFGGLDKLTVNRTVERPALLPIAPVEKDQVGLSWRPGGKWGITLDLTSRSQNEILPREEIEAGLSYQVTPRFRFGGGLTLKGDSLTTSLSSPEAWRQDQGEAGVKIESAFSF